MRLRSLVDRLRSPSQSVSRAPVQPNIDHTGSDAASAASVLEGTDVDEIGGAADRRRRGIAEADAHLREPCCRSGFYSPQQHAAIARSVARWCYRHFTPAKFSALQSHWAQTRTRRNLALIWKIKHGGA